MRDDKTPNLALPLPSPHNTLEEDVIRLRSAFGAIDTALSLLNDRFGGLLTGVSLVEVEGALCLRITAIAPETGAGVSVDIPIPIASANHPGLMSSADVAALTDLATAVESLSGRGVRYPVHLEGVEIGQASLQAAYETASGNTGAPVDGATLVDLDSNTAYTWYESSATWVTRGSDTVSVAANGVLGVVKGDAEGTPGKVYVESDGSMSVIGWDALAAAAGGVKVSDSHTWTAAQRGAIVELPSAVVITPNFAQANNFALTLAHNALLANPTGVVAGQSGVIVVTQDAVGNRSLAFGAKFVFGEGAAPEISTAAGSVDYLSYYVETAERIAILFRRNLR